ncbi:hypothetical protein [Brevibacterium samyangense]|uniref:NAD(P)H-binding protein n=1 Tax=Brevibacterium samyangense TaxID=366888 RepID=A0ABN2T7X6_9MICO
MQITVLGATGLFGGHLVPELRARGHVVVPASRATGVNAYTGEGLHEAIAGSDVVVDCLNKETLSKGASIDFFATAAEHVAREVLEVPNVRLVCVSIVGAADPATHRRIGYYAGKAVQERIYEEQIAPGRLLMFRSTQWFELARSMTARMSLGPLGAVPHFRSQPLAAVDAARLLADTIDAGESGAVEVAGLDVLDLAQVARIVHDASGARGRVFTLPFSMGTDALLPGPHARIGKRDLAAWIRENVQREGT